jgi:hypothetical protein
MIVLPLMDDGTFTSSNAMLYDTTKIYYKINGTTKVSNKNLIIDNDLFNPDIKNVANFSISRLDTAGLSKLKEIVEEQFKFDSLNKYNSLKEVTVFSKQKARLKELDKKYASGIFTGEAAAAFDMSTFQNASHRIDIYDFLDGKVSGLQFSSTEGGTIARVAEYRNGKASFYLNGNYINAREVENIEMSTIAYVKVFSPPAISGPNGSGGAIAIYTKKGDDINPKDNIPNGLDYLSYVGYVPHKEFYNPNYSEKSLDNIKDLRTTLLWNPWITLDKTHQKVKIDFYNNDLTNTFRLVLEGMDSKGKLVSIQKVLK